MANTNSTDNVDVRRMELAKELADRFCTERDPVLYMQHFAYFSMAIQAGMMSMNNQNSARDHIKGLVNTFEISSASAQQQR